MQQNYKTHVKEREQRKTSLTSLWHKNRLPADNRKRARFKRWFTGRNEPEVPRLNVKQTLPLTTSASDTVMKKKTRKSSLQDVLAKNSRV